MSKKTIVRTTKDRNNPYVMINKDAISDVRLSWKARGILAYVLSKPDDWKIILEHLEKESPDGKTSLRSGIDELKKYGYIVRVAVRKNNKIDHWEFWVNETPLAKPIEKYIHVNGDVLDELEERGESQYIFTEEGKTINPTLLSENRNVGKTRAKSLDSENLEVGFLEEGNLEVGNGKLLNNDFTDNEFTKENNNKKAVVVSYQSEIKNLLGIEMEYEEVESLHSEAERNGKSLRDYIHYVAGKAANNPAAYLCEAVRKNYNVPSVAELEQAAAKEAAEKAAVAEEYESAVIEALVAAGIDPKEVGY